MATRYAATTDVGSARSRDEIESTLRRYGASAFGYSWTSSEATVAFEIEQRRVRLRLPMPDANDRRFTHTEAKGLLRTPPAREAAYEQAVRQSWRALALVIKAKLEAVAAGISSIEIEFLYSVILPDGSTVGEWTAPQLAAVYATNTMPALMPGGGIDG